MCHILTGFSTRSEATIRHECLFNVYSVRLFTVTSRLLQYELRYFSRRSFIDIPTANTGCAKNPGLL